MDTFASSGGSMYFGFVPEFDYEGFSSSNYEERVESSRRILELVPITAAGAFQIPEFLDFLKHKACDENLSVAQNVALITSALISRMGSSVTEEYIDLIMQIVVQELGDTRRFVCQLGQAICCDLITSIGNDELVLAQLINSDPNPPMKLHLEMFRCVTHLMSQNLLRPVSLLQFPFFFDEGLVSTMGGVRQAAIWCLDHVKSNHAAEYEQLVSLLSRNSRQLIDKSKGENSRKIGTAVHVTNSMDMTTGGSYHRPLLPSGMSSRTMKPLTRPVSTSKFGLLGSRSPSLNTFVIEEEPTERNNDFSKTWSNTPLPDIREAHLEKPQRLLSAGFLDPINFRPSRPNTFSAPPSPLALSSEMSEPFSGFPNEPPILDPVTEPGERPIHSSGFYDLGDGEDGGEVNAPIAAPLPMIKPKRKLALTLSPKRPTSKRVACPIPLPRKELALPPVNNNRFAAVLEKLRDKEWNIQNDAIQELGESVDQKKDSISKHLRDISSILVECAGSLRTTLAKNALACLQKLIKTPQIDFDCVADNTAGGLLGVLTSQASHHFVASAAGDCFASLIESIPPQRAASILVNEHKRKHAPCRAKVALCMSQLVPRLTDASVLAKPLTALATDANQDVRRFAKQGLALLPHRSDDLSGFV